MSVRVRTVHVMGCDPTESTAPARSFVVSIMNLVSLENENGSHGNATVHHTHMELINFNAFRIF